MKIVNAKYALLRLLLLLLPALPFISVRSALGQDDPDRVVLLQTGPRTSPFDPGEASDTKFIIDAASGLDTGCTFRSGGPLTFDIDVTRYVGPVNADGTLKNPGKLVANGVVSEEARLIMPAFDVDVNAALEPPRDPERDRVLFNGKVVGFLDGLNNTWILNAFDIPTLIDQALEAGRHPLVFEGEGLASGLYLVRAQIRAASGQTHVFTEKVIFVR